MHGERGAATHRFLQSEEQDDRADQRREPASTHRESAGQHVLFATPAQRVRGEHAERHRRCPQQRGRSADEQVQHPAAEHGECHENEETSRAPEALEPRSEEQQCVGVQQRERQARVREHVRAHRPPAPAIQVAATEAERPLDIGRLQERVLHELYAEQQRDEPPDAARQTRHHGCVGGGQRDRFHRRLSEGRSGAGDASRASRRHASRTPARAARPSDDRASGWCRP